MKYKLKKNCTVCGLPVNKINSVKLKKLPVTEVLFKKKTKKKKFNLDQELKYCSKCHHAFLSKQYDIEYFYNSNNYMTSSTGAYSGRFTNDIFLEFIKKNINIKKKYNVLEIGANDLYLLEKFYNNINSALTIDPCVIPNKKLKKINCIKNFLENVDPKKIDFKPDIVICGHTLEHIADPLVFMKNLKKFTNKKTKFFFQFPSCESLIDRRAFDQVHHQHFNFFSVVSFNALLGKVKFVLNKFEICEHHYGSLMTYFKNDNVLSNYKKFRAPLGISSYKLLNSYKEYKVYMQNLIKIIQNYKKRGFKLYGVGAGLMLPLVNYHLNGILNSCDKLLDDDKRKINKFFPNINVPIKSLKNADLRKSLAIVCSTASSITTRKLIEVCKTKNANIILIPSLSF